MSYFRSTLVENKRSSTSVCGGSRVSPESEGRISGHTLKSGVLISVEVAEAGSRGFQYCRAEMVSFQGIQRRLVHTKQVLQTDFHVGTRLVLTSTRIGTRLNNTLLITISLKRPTVSFTSDLDARPFVRLQVDVAFLDVRIGRGKVEGDVQSKGGRVVDVRRGLGQDYTGKGDQSPGL